MGNHSLLADVDVAVILIFVTFWVLHGWPEDRMFISVKLRHLLKNKKYRKNLAKTVGKNAEKA